VVRVRPRSRQVAAGEVEPPPVAVNADHQSADPIRSMNSSSNSSRSGTHVEIGLRPWEGNIAARLPTIKNPLESSSPSLRTRLPAVLPELTTRGKETLKRLLTNHYATLMKPDLTMRTVSFAFDVPESYSWNSFLQTQYAGPQSDRSVVQASIRSGVQHRTTRGRADCVDHWTGAGHRRSVL